MNSFLNNNDAEDQIQISLTPIKTPDITLPIVNHLDEEVRLVITQIKTNKLSKTPTSTSILVTDFSMSTQKFTEFFKSNTAFNVKALKVVLFDKSQMYIQQFGDPVQENEQAVKASIDVEFCNLEKLKSSGGMGLVTAFKLSNELPNMNMWDINFDPNSKFAKVYIVGVKDIKLC